ncbi:hypothetical protein DAPPUDRAFT_239395 [Daphnia pulex]|uniref:Uncharacterized protein n=1 Tax=Daphnia pulex TaxID=6669 RepID=E9G972_DAPPU|nr:hypothetical protein DAPPUDRAFT_239395 [Daphnia pulex]|eukprot:EFX84141.1 hypothetical protein DAPPUDRAFT_239395 [Daphnia pulex]
MPGRVRVYEDSGDVNPSIFSLKLRNEALILYAKLLNPFYAMAARQDPEDIPLLNPERAGKMMQAANEFDGVANELDGNASTSMRRAAELIREAFQYPTAPVRPIAGLQPANPPQQEDLQAMAAMTISFEHNDPEGHVTDTTLI